MAASANRQPGVTSTQRSCRQRRANGSNGGRDLVAQLRPIICHIVQEDPVAAKAFPAPLRDMHWQPFKFYDVSVQVTLTA